MPDAGFEAWYQDEHPRVFAAAYGRCGDPALAEEVTAEAFVRALERWERVSAMRSPGAWTHRVAVNLLKRRLRRKALERRVSRAEHTPPDTQPEPEPALWAAVRALPSRQREAVVLRYVADLPEAEVAERMGVAPGTVAATLHAARARLAERLGSPAERTSHDG